jgi:DNA-directed RNA polymerase specialized sigma24 family protein
VTDIGPDPSDTDLVARARDGEDDAFAEIVRRHERRVYNLAYRMLGRT